MSGESRPRSVDQPLAERPAVSGQKEAIMATVTYITYQEGFGSSFSGTLSLGQQFPAAVAQVALTSYEVFQGDGSAEVLLTAYSTNGNPVPITDAPNVRSINNVDSFSWAGSSTSDRTAASITVYCFE
jgi:hypothetical protein